MLQDIFIVAVSVVVAFLILTMSSKKPKQAIRDIVLKKTARMIDQPERILCAAVHVDDLVERKNQCVPTGYVVCGRRHSDCYITLKIIDSSLANVKGRDSQGFMTSKNRYVDRIEALAIAIEQDQIWHKMFKKGEVNEVGLISEDLYYGDDKVGGQNV